MQPDKHTKYAGRDLDSKVLSAAELESLLTAALQALNPFSDNTGDREMQAAAVGLNEMVAMASARSRATVWEEPGKLNATLVMPAMFCTRFLSCTRFQSCTRSAAMFF